MRKRIKVIVPNITPEFNQDVYRIFERIKDADTEVDVCNIGEPGALYLTQKYDVVWSGLSVLQAAEQASDRFVQMREAEGAKMKEDLEERLDFILRAVEKVEERSPKTVEEYRARLYRKISEVLGNTQIDEQRILTEAAIYAEKIAVAEETVRLRSHIDQFRAIMQQAGPVGRKLDFLIQEFNREANTIGSKAQDIEIARIVVDIKSEIEKIREQIQNIE